MALTVSIYCLFHCVLKDLKLNRVAVSEPAPKGDDVIQQGNKKKEKKYDLAAADKFWSQHKVRYEESVAILILKVRKIKCI